MYFKMGAFSVLLFLSVVVVDAVVVVDVAVLVVNSCCCCCSSSSRKLTYFIFYFESDEDKSWDSRIVSGFEFEFEGWKKYRTTGTIGPRNCFEFPENIFPCKKENIVIIQIKGEIQREIHTITSEMQL
jgi:hypothetical protein